MPRITTVEAFVLKVPSFVSLIYDCQNEALGKELAAGGK
jgi:hypothetical protein